MISYDHLWILNEAYIFHFHRNPIVTLGLKLTFIALQQMSTRVSKQQTIFLRKEENYTGRECTESDAQNSTTEKNNFSKLNKH